MKKELGVQPWLFPMPTYMIGTYNEDDSVDVMMMAWGGICDLKMVALNLEAEHKTVKNLKQRGAFTLAVPGIETLRVSDFLGTATSNTMADKFERTGLSAVKSGKVDAPIIEEYPWSATWWNSKISPTASAYWARSSVCSLTKMCSTKMGKSTRANLTPSRSIRCETITTRSERSSARRGTPEPIS